MQLIYRSAEPPAASADPAATVHSSLVAHLWDYLMNTFASMELQTYGRHAVKVSH